jgi:hypothetical protein
MARAIQVNRIFELVITWLILPELRPILFA